MVMIVQYYKDEEDATKHHREDENIEVIYGRTPADCIRQIKCNYPHKIIKVGY